MLTVNQLNFNYPNSRLVLNSIDLDFTAGNIYGLFGKNGEGKSTLLKIMTGLLFPKTGNCTLNGAQHQKKKCRIITACFFGSRRF